MLYVTLCVAAALAVVPAASANVWVEKRCDSIESNVDGHWSASSPSVWSVGSIGSCPNSLAVGIPVLGEAFHFGKGEYSLHATLEPASEPVSRIFIRMSGSNGSSHGVEQGFKLCDAEGQCTPRYMLEDGDPDGQEFLFDVDDPLHPMPEGTVTIAASAECVADAGCTPPEWLFIDDIEIGHVDNAPPITDIVPEFPVGSGDNGWIRGDFYLLASAGDAQSGVSWVEGSAVDMFDDEFVVYECGERDVFVNISCSNYPDHAELVDIDRMRQGENTAHARAQDWAGNIGGSSATYFVDSISPPKPSNVNMRPGRLEWLRSATATVTWDHVGETVQNETQSGIASSEAVFSRIVGGYGSLTESIPGQGKSFVVTFPDTSGVWQMRLSTTDRAGNKSFDDVKEFRFDTVKPGAPVFSSAIEPIGIDDLESGRHVDWDWTTVGASGICSTSLALNATPGFTPAETIANSAILGGVSEFTITPQMIENAGDGQRYLHTRGISCAEAAGGIARPSVLIDTKEPTAEFIPNGWTDGGLQKVIVGSDPLRNGKATGVERIDYQLDAQTGSVEGNELWLDLTAGPHSLTYEVFDRVGNSSGVETRFFNVDADAPSVWLTRGSDDDPTAFTAHADDDHSGVVALWAELQAESGGAAYKLGDGFIDQAPSPGEVSLDFRVDDQVIPEGRYTLVAVGVDQSGKRMTSSTWEDGSPASLELPLRTKTALAAEIGTNKKFGQTLRAAFGSAVKVRGRLVLADGKPLPNRSVTIQARHQGGVRRLVGTATTNESGTFEYALRAGPSRRITVDFAGSNVFAGSSHTVDLKVSAKVTARGNRRVVPRGQRLRIRGQVSDGGAGFPPHGKIVVLQFKIGRRWSNISKSVRAFDDGRFATAFSYRPRAAKKRIRFRVVSTLEGGWPFEQGVSKEFSAEFRR